MRLNHIFLIGIIAVVTIIGSTVQAASPLPTLSIDSTGEDVVMLQQKLKDIGYTISVDGVFGEETKSVVEQFQHDNKITVTGIVNEQTWRKLKKARPIQNKNNSSSSQSDDSDSASGNDNSDNSPVIISDGELVPYGIILISKSQADELVRTAKSYIGVPYVFGGTTPDGFDCSGFVQYVFRQQGIIIPRLADEQYLLGRSANISELNAGDLVFFTTYEAGASHCGIYVGNRQFLHTSSSRGVRIDDIDNVYWSPRFFGAKKIVRV
ncbi:MAG: C40 family peptidase [Selenomonadaceae bacterium]|nr:C40 family peptidase [Selenomonadaceae bacterium]